MLVKVIALVFGAFGLVAFALRVASRVLVGNQAWGPDDWVLTVAVVRTFNVSPYSHTCSVERNCWLTSLLQTLVLDAVTGWILGA